MRPFFCQIALCGSTRFRIVWLLTIGILLAPGNGWAGSWRVIPIRLDFNKKTHSGVVSIANDDTVPLTVRVEADQWLQGDEGKDRYIKSDDLIFFPQVLTVGPKEERVVRVGIKTPAIKTEKTYRLFISEDPSARKPQGTGVAIAIRFGVPIFVEPLQKEPQGEIQGLALEQGKAHFSVANTGNVHFRIKTVKATGFDTESRPLFSKDLSAWYVLAGVSRQYDLEIPQESCLQLHTLSVEVTSDDRAPLNQQINVDQAACLRK